MICVLYQSCSTVQAREHVRQNCWPNSEKQELLVVQSIQVQCNISILCVLRAMPAFYPELFTLAVTHREAEKIVLR